MAASSEKSGLGVFRLFSSPEDDTKSVGFGFGFDDSVNSNLPPPPPSIEVLSSEVTSSVSYTVESLKLGEITLLKGRVSTKEVLALSNLDLVPGKYEGGLKLWEGSLDLVKALQSEVQDQKLSFTGKRVLELGCGHGLPGIFACLQGAAVTHFQDFNAEVLRCLTIPNIIQNLSKKTASSDLDEIKNSEIRYYAGDWSQVHKIFPLTANRNSDDTHSEEKDHAYGYDIILMAETVYSTDTFQNLYNLLKLCVSRPNGVIYMAGKKHYFGVGGGTRQFLSVVEKDGFIAANLVAEIADGSSNVREVWKLSLKQNISGV
ncbi:unnamed protein product [Rhodiola kirilowii]